MTFGIGTALAPAQSTKTTRHRTVRGLEMTQELQESVIVSKKKKSNTFPSLLDWYVLWSTLAPSRRWTSSLVVNLNIHVTVTVTSDSREKHHQFLGE